MSKPSADSEDVADFDEEMFGSEAAVAMPEGLPRERSRLPTMGPEQLAELEQRVRDARSPAFPTPPQRTLPLGFLWRRYREFALRDRSTVVDEFGRDPITAARARRLLDALSEHYFRLEYRGLEHIPARGGALLVANHSGALPWDALLLTHLIARKHPARREVRPLLEDSTMHAPFLGTLLARVGAVRACQEHGQRILQSQRLAVVFPEGAKGLAKTSRQRFELQRFGRGGFVKLAITCKVPIIPVAILGVDRAYPVLRSSETMARLLGLPHFPLTPLFPWLGPLGLLPLPTSCLIAFGEPYHVGDLPAEMTSQRAFVGSIADDIRLRVAALMEEHGETFRGPKLG